MNLDTLPEECILRIISFLILSDQRWKRKPKKKQVWCSIEKGGGIDVIKPPLTSLFPLIFSSRGMKEMFDTNEIWSYLYEQDFRSGKSFKRRPKEIKRILFSKCREIMNGLYEPILQLHKDSIVNAQEKLRINLHQIHSLEVAFTNIRPQIKRRESIDKHISSIGVIIPVTIRLEEGYVYPWGGVTTTTPIRLDIKKATEYIESHRYIAKRMLDKIHSSRDFIENFTYLD